MALTKLILDTRTKKADETFPIKLSVFHRSTSLLGLDISVTKEQWSGKDNVDRQELKILSGIEIINHPKAKFLNGILRIKLNQAETMILNLSASGKLKKLSQSELIYFIQTNDTDPAPKKVYGLEDHFCKYIANCRAKRTGEIYQETLDKIKKYSQGVLFEEVNLIWLRAFDNYLAESCGLNTRSIHRKIL